LIVKTAFRTLPEGLNDARITRVEDLGLQETRSGKKEMAAIYFTAVDKPGCADARLKVRTQDLHPDSNVAKLLRQLDIPFAGTFDLSTLLGIRCQIIVQHGERDGETYASVVSVLKFRMSSSRSSLSRH